MFQTGLDNVTGDTVKRISLSGIETQELVAKASDVQKPQLLIEWCRTTLLTVINQLRNQHDRERLLESIVTQVQDGGTCATS